MTHIIHNLITSQRNSVYVTPWLNHVTKCHCIA